MNDNKKKSALLLAVAASVTSVPSVAITSIAGVRRFRTVPSARTYSE